TSCTPHCSTSVHIYRLRLTAVTTMVDLMYTCTPEVFLTSSVSENRSLQVTNTRKDSAVHVSLSSSSLVKQPGSENPYPNGVASLELACAGKPSEALIRRQMTTDGYRLLIHSS